MTINHLQLVIPELLAQLRQSPDGDAKHDALPALRQCLQQGERSRLWQSDDISHAHLESWQQSLLAALPSELRVHALPSAALTWRGEGGAQRKGSCLLAEPVHLQAGMDDLRYLQSPPLTDEEATQLLHSLQPLLSLAGFELALTADQANGTWYLWCDRDLQLTTFSLRSQCAARIYDLMPQGADSAGLRRLMTEIQMLLHDHPVNKHRERRSQLTVNALWFAGAGDLTLVSQPLPQRVMSDAVYMRGLCEHLHTDCWPMPSDVPSLLSVDTLQVLMVLPAMSLAAVESAWLQPLLAALQDGEIKQLDLYLDQWCIRMRGGRWQQLRRRFTGDRHDIAELLI